MGRGDEAVPNQIEYQMAGMFVKCKIESPEGDVLKDTFLHKRPGACNNCTVYENNGPSKMRSYRYTQMDGTGNLSKCVPRTKAVCTNAGKSFAQRLHIKITTIRGYIRK